MVGRGTDRVLLWQPKPNSKSLEPQVRSRSPSWMAVRLISVSLAFFICGGFATLERLLAPNADLWERWDAHNPANTERIDHSAWNDFLLRYVLPGPEDSTRVRYAGVTHADRAALDRYLGALGEISISNHSRDEQLAYWINLYNALTVKVVLDHYPVTSIRDIKISPGLFAIGPWEKKLITIEGETISLNDIEHRIIRPIWRDARVHYALNCASIGCPRLATSAYVGASLDGRLTQAAITFINSSSGVRATNGQVTASRIYDWFYSDFGGSDSAVLDHILGYLNAEKRAVIQLIGKIHDVDYDWRLNDAG